MRIGVVSLFPEMFSPIRDYGVCGRAFDEGLATLDVWNPRDFATDRHRSVDDRPYGGGPGMVMTAPPVTQALRKAKDELGRETPCLYLSPQGRRLDQAFVQSLAGLPAVLMLAGRYEGVDERAIEAEVDCEVSLGDFVLSGGEIAAMALADAILRLLPGTLGDAESARQDSFSDGLLDFAHYTRPERFEGSTVPEVLLSGDHEKVRLWRLKQALGRTWLRRPELMARRGLSILEKQLLEEFIFDRVAQRPAETRTER